MEFALQPSWQSRINNSYRGSRPPVGVLFCSPTRPRPFRVAVYSDPRLWSCAYEPNPRAFGWRHSVPGKNWQMVDGTC